MQTRPTCSLPKPSHAERHVGDCQCAADRCAVTGCQRTITYSTHMKRYVHRLIVPIYWCFQDLRPRKGYTREEFLLVTKHIGTRFEAQFSAASMGGLHTYSQLRLTGLLRLDLLRDAMQALNQRCLVAVYLSALASPLR
jgi:hypothetical protein